MPILAGLLGGLVVALIELLGLPGPWSDCYWSEIREALVLDGALGLLGGVALALGLALFKIRLRRTTTVHLALAAGGIVYVVLARAAERLLGGPPPIAGAWLLCAALALPLVGDFLPSTPRRMLTGATVLTLVAAALLDLGSAPDSPRVTSRGNAAADAPNVVVVIWDATRRDHVSAQGYDRPTTPFLDGLAREGVVYEHAYSPATWTVPSHASLFTGLYPSSHGMSDEHGELSPDLPTLPGTLAAAGYESVAFVANPFLTARTGFANGFDTFFEAWRRRRLLGDVITRQWRVLIARHSDKGAEVVLSAIDRWLDRRDPDRPYFMFVNVLDVHPHLWPLQPYRSAFLAGTSSLRAARVPQREYALLEGLIHLDDDDRKIVSDLYDGEIAYLDAMTAKLRERLLARTHRRTLFVVTADHGSTLGENDLIGVIGFSEDMAKVPLVVQMPGVFEGGGMRSVPVSLVDLVPTILDVAGLPADAMGHLPGRSLLALARDGVTDRTVFSENEVRVTTIEEADAKYGRHPAWLDLRSKGAWSNAAGLTWTSDGAVTLRDDESAPSEPARAQVIADLKDRIVAAVGAPAAGPALARERSFEPAERAQLRSLGYVQ